MSGFSNEYPYNENPFSNHFSFFSNESNEGNVKYNDKLLSSSIDYRTNNSSILEKKDNEVINPIGKDVISKSLKDNIHLARKYSRSNYCCATHCAFTSDKSKIPLVTITDALKITDMSGSSFIVYVIRTSEPEKNSTLLEVRRRYSEFATLRNLLHQYYPSLIIPPIPEKHSITEYAIKQGKAKDNPKIIEKRKRMLQVFLNRLGKHPVFASLHIFHVFLEPGNWLEYEQKMTKISIPISITSFNESEELQYKEIKKNVKEFMKCISILSKAHHNLNSIYQNLSNSYSSLGASYNGWSLHEIVLSPVLESVGQSFDSNRLALSRMASLLDISIIESLQEYNAFSKIILNIIAWYKNNYRQYYYICNSLNKKQKRLENLEKAEKKAQEKRETLKAKESKKMAETIKKEAEQKKEDNNNLISDDDDDDDVNDIEEPKDDSLLRDPKFKDLANSTSYPYSENIPTSDFGIDNKNVNGNLDNSLNDTLYSNDLKSKSIFESINQDEINPKMNNDNEIFNDINKVSTILKLPSQENVFQENIIYNEPSSFEQTNDNSSSSVVKDQLEKPDIQPIDLNRHNEIKNVKENIVRLQKLKETQYKEIIKSGKEIQHDFNYFQREKYSDFKQILIHYAKINREYNEQMIKVWNNMIKIWSEIRV
ncbi:hypothetical protein H8356DRAFT_1016411 [Neocallimastix lanati (nom. inval.)]|jgi:hypothetical protein|uniref:PX domain-containing protein n=1 Tax=Neocallimastix californiae TaxID=1754190 RepID=A0A1Y2CEC1_9FUNG|nr:hypothetical protein H8356DRAFT_1016411 [Neocallimastix sp. JGI-2020a]ORY45408.1 hypothetical protein LY90DRAFT_671529 [Neocallimastix californiae]|eukprot:ORY45408.1 hypothetical protein LY90DRAFT_671529 [Neocallimastix californiae]